MNWSMEYYTDTRRQTVLLPNGEWKTESCQKKSLTACQILARIIFSFSAGLNLPLEFCYIHPELVNGTLKLQFGI